MHFSKKYILGTAKLNESFKFLIFKKWFSVKKYSIYKNETYLNVLFSYNYYGPMSIFDFCISRYALLEGLVIV